MPYFETVDELQILLRRSMADELVEAHLSGVEVGKGLTEARYAKLVKAAKQANKVRKVWGAIDNDSAIAIEEALAELRRKHD